MTADDIYNVAGQANGMPGTGGDGSPETSVNLYLNSPTGVVHNNGKQLYIADAGNNQIQQVAHTKHIKWGISMIA